MQGYPAYPYPSPPPPPPRAGWPPAAQAAVGCGAACALVVLLEFVFFWGVIQLTFGGRPPRELEGKVTPLSPPAAGQPFPLELSLRNGGTSTLEVKQIVFRTQDALKLAAPQPAAAHSTEVLGTQTWTYQHKLEPGKSWKVRFQATAPKAGTVESRIEVFAPGPKSFDIKLEVAAPGGKQPKKGRNPA